MIQLTETLEYNTELSFEEQSDEVKTFINKMMNSHMPEEYFEPAGVTNRVIRQIWEFQKYSIVKLYEYTNPPESDRNGIISNELITIKTK